VLGIHSPHHATHPGARLVQVESAVNAYHATVARLQLPSSDGGRGETQYMVSVDMQAPQSMLTSLKNSLRVRPLGVPLCLAHKGANTAPAAIDGASPAQPALAQLRQSISDQVHAAREQQLAIQDRIDNLNEQLLAAQENISLIESQLMRVDTSITAEKEVRASAGRVIRNNLIWSLTCTGPQCPSRGRAGRCSA